MQGQQPHPLSGTVHLLHHQWTPSGKEEMKIRPWHITKSPCNILRKCKIIWQVVNWPFVTVLIKICKSRTEPLECKLVMVSITRVGSWWCGTRRCCLCRWGRWWRNPSQLRTPSPSPWSVPPPVPKKCSFQKQFIAIGNVGKIKCTCCHLVLPWQWCSLHLLPRDSHKHWNNKLILTKF